jgi:hypothetical protein
MFGDGNRCGQGPIFSVELKHFELGNLLMVDESIIADVVALLGRWAGLLQTNIGTDGVYLFGSLIHRDGKQFGSGSDVDLVVVLPSKIDGAVDRVEWLENLQKHKLELESDLVGVLKRSNAKIPICSIVAATSIELTANIHKDGAIGFFSKNQFLDLLNTEIQNGLPGSGTLQIDERLLIEFFRFAQKKRNTYLGICADGSSSFFEYSGDDPIPKDIMRHAAMVRQLHDLSDTAGAEYDTQRGLDFLSVRLYQLQSHGPMYAELSDKVSVRRGARGAALNLSPGAQYPT